MAQHENTDLFRGMTGNLIAGCFALLVATGPALGATAIKIGRTPIPNISHLPIYVAMETGLFRQEELDARFVALPARVLATTELGGTIDLFSLPDSGAKAAVKGSAIFLSSVSRYFLRRCLWCRAISRRLGS